METIFVNNLQNCEPTDLSIPLFLNWFQANGGITSSSFNIVTFPTSEGGRGAIALEDIPEGHVLFAIPRFLTLTTQTSALPSLFGLEAWKSLKLHKGWAGLILCMMWEASQGNASRWKQYLDILPTTFDTPMFWSHDELAELHGTSAVEKIGKDEAENDYKDKVVPATQSRPDLFFLQDLLVYYSLDVYHVMGSRILSRSFNVEKWETEEGEADDDPDKSFGSAMNVDTETPQVPFPSPSSPLVDIPPNETDAEPEKVGAEVDGEDEDEEDSSDVAMVPMADILNARYGSENAKLFHEKIELRMISTKPIKRGEQIWNTYGDLPNSELLRRYGHVDFLPLPQGEKGNPGDVVEIRADLIVSTVLESYPQCSEDTIRERIDWWLEEGGDDTFAFELDLDVPPASLALSRLLLLSDEDWQKAREKGKPPKPKLDTEILAIHQSMLRKRLAEYPTTIHVDEDLLRNERALNRRHAIIVRLGEKRILQRTLDKIALTLEAQKHQGNGKMKRKPDSEASSNLKVQKKSKR